MAWFENNPHSKRVASFSQSGPWEHYKIGKLIIADADFYDVPREPK